MNDRGTAAVPAAGARAGIRRIVHLSSTAVHGQGPHAGIGPDEVPAAPVSEAGRARRHGEGHPLAAGAAVLGPALVIGTGDRRVVPALAEPVRRVPGRWAGGEVRLAPTGPAWPVLGSVPAERAASVADGVPGWETS